MDHLSSASEKVHGCNPCIFIFTSIWDGVKSKFRIMKKDLMLIQKKYVYSYHLAFNSKFSLRGGVLAASKVMTLG